MEPKEAKTKKGKGKEKQLRDRENKKDKTYPTGISEGDNRETVGKGFVKKKKKKKIIAQNFPELMKNSKTFRKPNEPPPGQT